MYISSALRKTINVLSEFVWHVIYINKHGNITILKLLISIFILIKINKVAGVNFPMDCWISEWSCSCFKNRMAFLSFPYITLSIELQISNEHHIRKGSSFNHFFNVYSLDF